MGAAHSSSEHVEDSSGCRPSDEGDEFIEDMAQQRADWAKRMIELEFMHMAERRKRCSQVEGLVGQVADIDEKMRIRREHSRSEVAFSRVRNHGASIDEFEELAVIGKGASGVVSLVRWSATDQVYAMKKIPKSFLNCIQTTARAWVERQVLAEAEDPYMLQMQAAFQDEAHLYLVMEFLPGGDMMSLLIREGRLNERHAQFYAAQLIRSIDAIHRMGFLHRDIKPDNILLDAGGHLKVADFGLCKALVAVSDVDPSPWTVRSSSSGIRRQPSLQIEKLQDRIARMTTKERMRAWREVARDTKFSAVGSPNYVSPEVLVDDHYGEECDWWSVGAVLYEMLVGYPPFLADSPELICKKIVNFHKTLHFPRDVPISPEAENLIRNLLCDQSCRLGANGIEDFMNHKFFAGIDWANMRETSPPFTPKLKHDADTRYFGDEVERLSSPRRVSGATDVSSPRKGSPGSHGRPPSRKSSGSGGSGRPNSARILDRLDDEDFVGFSFHRYRPISPSTTNIVVG